MSSYNKNSASLDLLQGELDPKLLSSVISSVPREDSSSQEHSNNSCQYNTTNDLINYKPT